MSIVAVHGPNTFGSKAVRNSNGAFQAMAVSGDGRSWRFIPTDQSKPAAQYDWSWAEGTGTTGGSPASPLNDTMIANFTFPAGPATKVITLTLNAVAQPTLTITIPAAGAVGSPMMFQAPPEEGGGGEEAPDVGVGFDPAAHTVEEVEEFVSDHPDQAQAVYDLEIEGKQRVTLITWLEDFEA